MEIADPGSATVELPRGEPIEPDAWIEDGSDADHTRMFNNIILLPREMSVHPRPISIDLVIETGPD